MFNLTKEYSRSEGLERAEVGNGMLWIVHSSWPSYC